ncbi:MAG: hypothetical protein M0P69_12965 [Bacteroidales bacterium]|nr:hypothetical protein [Bacteroidales bacterium]
MNGNTEFGKGFTYCIGLFLAHAEREDTGSCGLWFNAAADHLYELEIPKKFKFKKECEEWQNKCLDLRLNKANKKQKTWAIDMAKTFLLAWDRQCGIDCCEAEWK